MNHITNTHFKGLKINEMFVLLCFYNLFQIEKVVIFRNEDKKRRYFLIILSGELSLCLLLVLSSGRLVLKKLVANVFGRDGCLKRS